MKKSILTLAAFTFFALGCESPAQKVDSAEKEVNIANKDLDDAQDAYKEEVKKYRIETADKIAANNQSIIDFRNRISKEKKEARADYNAKIEKLEAKNSDMRKRMEDYREDSKENWETFKKEFNHDMDALGESFKDLTVKNVK